jgi:hypothetical protein
MIQETAMFNRSNDSRDKSLTQSQTDRAMKPEQFDQVIAAILSGKYSWACVLILSFSGYNPLHYIPYRTYNRIIKDNMQKPNQKMNIRNKPIKDVSYLDELSELNVNVRGGSRPSDHSTWLQGWFGR